MYLFFKLRSMNYIFDRQHGRLTWIHLAVDSSSDYPVRYLSWLPLLSNLAFPKSSLFTFWLVFIYSNWKIVMFCYETTMFDVFVLIYLYCMLWNDWQKLINVSSYMPLSFLWWGHCRSAFWVICKYRTWLIIFSNPDNRPPSPFSWHFHFLSQTWKLPFITRPSITSTLNTAVNSEASCLCCQSALSVCGSNSMGPVGEEGSNDWERLEFVPFVTNIGASVCSCVSAESQKWRSEKNLSD